MGRAPRARPTRPRQRPSGKRSLGALPTDGEGLITTSVLDSPASRCPLRQSARPVEPKASAAARMAVGGNRVEEERRGRPAKLADPDGSSECPEGFPQPPSVSAGERRGTLLAARSVPHGDRPSGLPQETTGGRNYLANFSFRILRWGRRRDRSDSRARRLLGNQTRGRSLALCRSPSSSEGPRPRAEKRSLRYPPWPGCPSG